MKTDKSGSFIPISKLPSIKELEKMMNQAIASRSFVLQPIILPNSDRTLVLKVQSSTINSSLSRGLVGRDSSPYRLVWSLQENKKTIWSYETLDLELIYNTLLDSVPEFVKKESAVQFNSGHFSPLPADTLGGMADNLSPPAAPAYLEQSNSGAYQPFPGNNINLSGSLAEVELSAMLQSVSICRMSGCLDVTNALKSVEVFFEEGKAIHSIYSDDAAGGTTVIAGEEVILEALTWDSGYFQFHPQRKSHTRTPMRKLESLLMEGMALRDYLETLKNNGLGIDDVPVAKQKELSSAQVESTIASALPISLEMQQRFLALVDGNNTFVKIAQDLGLSKTQWLPLAYNLFKQGIVSAKGRRESIFREQVIIEDFFLEEGRHQLLKGDTNLIGFPLMLYFLNVEQKRALKIRIPLSLAVISLRKETADGYLSSSEVRMVGDAIFSALEPFDFVGHFEGMDLALIMPHRSSIDCAKYVAHIIEKLADSKQGDGRPLSLLWSVGIACIPENSLELGPLIAAAKAAKEAASLSGTEIVCADGR